MVRPRGRRRGRALLAGVIGLVVIVGIATTVGIRHTDSGGGLAPYQPQSLTGTFGTVKLEHRPVSVAALGPGDTDAVASLGSTFIRHEAAAAMTSHITFAKGPRRRGGRTSPSEALVDRPVQVGAEPAVVDAHGGLRQRGDVLAGDEGAAAGSDRAQLGDRLTVAGDDERLAGRHRVDHLGVGVAQFTLCDGFGHRRNVMNCAIARYALR